MARVGINQRLLTCDVQEGDWVIAYSEPAWNPLFFGSVVEIQDTVLYIARWGGRSKGGIGKALRRLCEVYKTETEASAAYHRRIEERVLSQRRKQGPKH